MKALKSAPFLLLVAAVGLLAWMQFDGKDLLSTPSENESLVSASLAKRVYELEAKAGAAHVQERVIHLPEDGHVWQTVIVYATPDKSSSADRHLASAFATTPRLQSLVAQTKTYEYDAEHWWVRRHLAGNPLPAVLVMQPGGNGTAKRAFKASGENLPLDGEPLADAIAQGIADCRPKPSPQPQPAPPPDVAPIPDSAPDLDEPTEPEDQLGMILYAVIAAAGLGGAGLALKKEHGL